MLSQTVTGGTGTQTQWSYSGGTNQPDQGCHDAAGNMLGMVSCDEYTWDGEGRMSSANGIGYVYNAAGQRVAKFSGTTLTNAYLYDPEGRVVTEFDGSFNVVRREVYAGGHHLGTYDNNGNLTYAMVDWIGTERARTDSTGALCQTTTSQPFGDNQQTNGTCFPSPDFFTGKQRDPESGNDYFGARYYTSGIGRFMSPDWSAKVEPIPYSKLGDPQSLNLYAYVRNNPISGVDADGHDSFTDTQVLERQPQCGKAESSCVIDSGQAANLDHANAQRSQAQQKTIGGGFLGWVNNVLGKAAPALGLAFPKSGRAPMSDGPTQAAKQFAKGMPKESPNYIPREVSTPTPNLLHGLKPGELPASLPEGATAAEKLALAGAKALELARQIGATAGEIIDTIPLVCANCNVYQDNHLGQPKANQQD